MLTYLIDGTKCDCECEHVSVHLYLVKCLPDSVVGSLIMIQ